jgi:hypothetical protein
MIFLTDGPDRLENDPVSVPGDCRERTAIYNTIAGSQNLQVGETALSRPFNHDVPTHFGHRISLLKLALLEVQASQSFINVHSNKEKSSN